MYTLSNTWRAAGKNLDDLRQIIKRLAGITKTLVIQPQLLDLGWVGPGEKMGYEQKTVLKAGKLVLPKSDAYLEFKNEVTDCLLVNYTQVYYLSKNAVTDLGRIAGIGGDRFYQPHPARTQYLTVKLADLESDNPVTIVYREKKGIKKVLGIRGKDYVCHNFSMVNEACDYLETMPEFKFGNFRFDQEKCSCKWLGKDGTFIRVSDSMAGGLAFVIEAGLMVGGLEMTFSRKTIEHRASNGVDDIHNAIDEALKETTPFISKIDKLGKIAVSDQKEVIDLIWKTEGDHYGKRDGYVGNFKKKYDEEVKNMIKSCDNLKELLICVYQVKNLVPDEYINKKAQVKNNYKETVEKLLG